MDHYEQLRRLAYYLALAQEAERLAQMDRVEQCNRCVDCYPPIVLAYPSTLAMMQ